MPQTAPAADSQAKIIVRRQGALTVLTLNRPQALNAFDDDMSRAMLDEIPAISRNPDVYIVALVSDSPKAFCAGGDVKALTRLATTDMAEAKACFEREYRLDWLLDCFSKPTVSLINGLCMGSGAGLTSFNTHRVAGEGYKWGMPETAIGLFPDVGVAHVLARMPWPIGLYLGLTGRVIERADAHWLGLVTHCIDHDKQAGILEKLADAEPVDPLLDHLHQAQSEGALRRDYGTICAYFQAGSVAEIVRRLETATGVAEDWARKTAADLRKRSPLSLALTERHIRTARSLDLRETLIQDYRLAVRCLEDNDFAEGVRAVLVDKDGSPNWQPARIEDVTDAMLDRYFAPLGADDLALPSRVDMQAARV